ncbi:glycosyltransferase [Gracilibacillus sp. D59]|uniref:glycosyltransferase n=1 Tax=Gracilibacillus sp. D59 TaxID=3457434 RepID=UPI003FCEB9FE
MKLTACIITKNEEKNIEKCLNSVKPIVSEIVVVDTGSTDSTVDKAKKIGAKVYHFEWVNDFAKAKNFAISKATGDWIISLDADEYLENVDYQLMKNCINKADKSKSDGLFVNLMNYDVVLNKILSTIPKIKIFRNDSHIQYYGAIHETVKRLNENIRVIDMKEKITIVHTGYSSGEIERKKKGERNLSMLLEEVSSNPEDHDLNFYLSETYSQMGEFELALFYSLRAFEIGNSELLGAKEKNVLNILKYMKKLEFPNDEIEKVIFEANNLYPSYPDFYVYLGDYHRMHNQPEDAILMYEKAVSLMDHNQNVQGESQVSSVIIPIYKEIASQYYKLSDFSQSVHYWTLILNNEPYHYSTLKNIIKVFINNKENDTKIINFFNNIYNFGKEKDLVYLLKASLQNGAYNISQYFIDKLSELNLKLNDEELDLKLIKGNYEGIALEYIESFEKDSKQHFLLKAFVTALLENDEIVKDKVFEKLKQNGFNITDGIDGDTVEFLIRTVQILIDYSSFEKIDTILELVNDNEFLLNVGELVYQSKGFNIALVYFDRYIQLNSDIEEKRLTDILYKMSNSLYQLGEFETASRYINEAYKIDGNSYVINSLLLKIFEKVNNDVDLEKAIIHACSMYPSSEHFISYKKNYQINANIRTNNENNISLKKLLYSESFLQSLEEKSKQLITEDRKIEVEQINKFLKREYEKARNWKGQKESKMSIQKTENKKVLIIAYIFPPLGGSGVQRTLKFVKYLRNFGWEPVVVTVGNNSFNFIDEKLESEIPQNIEIIRVDDPQIINKSTSQEVIDLYINMGINRDIVKSYVQIANKNINNLSKLLLPEQQIIWANNVLKNIKKQINIEEVDIIYSTSGPYSDHIVGYYLKKEFNKPWVADFRDEWSNNPYININHDSIMYKMIYSMESILVNFSDSIVTTTPLASENYRNTFNLKGDKISTITNGYDEQDFEVIQNKTHQNEKFTLLHNGLFYMIRTPETIIEAVNKLVSTGLIPKDKILIQFSWSENLDKWKTKIMNYGISECFEFIGYMNHQQSLECANAADLLLLVSGPGEKNKAIFPGKLFEYFRLNKPILSLSPQKSVVENLINKLNRGYNVDFNDIDGIQNIIHQYYLQWENDELPVYEIDENIQQYERNNLTEKLVGVFDQQLNNFETLKGKLKELKAEIMELVYNEKFIEAYKLIPEYRECSPNDVDLYSIEGIIKLNINQIDEAELAFKKGLKIDSNNVDLLYNLGFLYQIKEHYRDSVDSYQKAFNHSDEAELKNEIKNIINEIKRSHPNEKSKKRIAFFAIPNGGDKFLGDIIEGLSKDYEVKKVIVSDLKQIDQGMEWADICWFEWCDQLVAYGSKLPLAKNKRLICRIHRYEVFTNNPLNVNWNNVDKLIIVTDHLLKILEKRVPDIRLKVSVETIQNGVDLDKYDFTAREKGYNLAFIGDVIYRKNPFFMLQIMKKIVDVDNRYNLSIAGRFSDPLIKEYWDYQIKELGLENNIHFDGWIEDVNSWLKNKQYILAPSIHESFGYFIAEAMASGIKPIIHNFLYAKEIWPKEYLFNTIDECIEIIISNNYQSNEYREFIKKNYLLEKQIVQTVSVIYNLVNSENDNINAKFCKINSVPIDINFKNKNL